MSITDELREYAEAYEGSATHASLDLIADRIDAEHENDMAAAALIAGVPMTDEHMAEHGWIRLPLDADGVPIRVGDVMEWTTPHLGVPKVFEVQRIIMDPSGWHLVAYPATYAPEECCHHHAPTVEDVLREFALKVAGEECMTIRKGVVEEYAKRLALADDEGADTCQA